ncbi:MAG TPA: UDP-N-acetylmuramoyl-L-alanine--D-glutamate ligase [Polyangiaceae bacterium]|nr:UDP-N-acetylmuramoyl-L-alanine--D-glutamate ligase [Polyangiaceae bacterium]
MELSGKHVIVVGLGKSGIAAARLCVERGAKVTGTDSAPRDKLSRELDSLDIEVVAGTHQGVRFDRSDLVVVSPGVPALAELEVASEAGAEVIGELELASRFLDEMPLVVIGGTNGKSTTTTLVGELLSAAGRKVFTGGNLGTPACAAVGEEWDAVVYEVSSFQLERAPTLKPRVSVLLNVTEDHLDRYPSFQAYAEAKGNAFVNQNHDDCAIVPFGDVICEEQARRGQGRLISFGEAGDYPLEGTTVVENTSGERYELGGSRLHGRHNHGNAAAAVAAARCLDVGPASIRLGLGRFEPLGHRMALVAELKGVRYYDDSKGTNVGAAVTALTGLLEERAVLIAGGRDKQGSYEPLVAALKQKARAVVVIGEAAERIRAAIKDELPVHVAVSMDEAVRQAALLAKPGDAVLLSPACSSFDMFKSYAERGDRFAEAVRSLKGAP